MEDNRTSDLDMLVEAAVEARKRAYSPYSKFAVGAAVRSTQGRIFLGCNIENAAFGASMCAERAAVFSAISAGDRSFTHMALVADQTNPLSPCGTCRQVLAELAPNIILIMANLRGDTRLAPINELLPLVFRFERSE